MIEGRKVLGIIPARGGSKGLPRKNIRALAGKPLLAWTIEAGLASKYLDRLILSSDDDEIIRVARQWKCEAPFVRPAELASDVASGIAPVLHALDQLPGFDLVVLLQPTSPLRTARDIDECVEHCISRQAPACVSVTFAEPSPYWTFTLNAAHRLQPLLSAKDVTARRQDLPAAYNLNGAVYVARVDWLRERREFVTEETIAYVMPAERSLDIDDAKDLEYAEFIIRESRHGTLR